MYTNPLVQVWICHKVMSLMIMPRDDDKKETGAGAKGPGINVLHARIRVYITATYNDSFNEWNAGTNYQSVCKASDMNMGVVTLPGLASIKLIWQLLENCNIYHAVPWDAGRDARYDKIAVSFCEYRTCPPKFSFWIHLMILTWLERINRSDMKGNSVGDVRFWEMQEHFLKMML